MPKKHAERFLLRQPAVLSEKLFDILIYTCKLDCRLDYGFGYSTLVMSFPEDVLMSQSAESSSPSTDPIAPAIRKRNYRPSRDTWIQIATAIVILALWEYAGSFANPLLVAVPTEIAVAAWELTVTGELPVAIVESMASFAVGFAIAAVLGMIIGTAMGASRTIETMLDPYVNALYSMPLIALVPILMLWAGIGFTSKVTIVAMFSVFPLIINTLAGVRNVESSYLDIGCAFGATKWMTFTQVIIPSAVPYIASGMRLAVSRGIIAMIIAEFLTSISGLGGLIINYTNQFQTAKAFVPVIVLAIIGNILTYLVKIVENKFSAWH